MRIDKLEEDGLYDKSLILIWGDHGSFTNISSALGQTKNILPELANSQVPMIILAPNLKQSGAVHIPASHLDIYPTIANLLGINPPKTILGQDLMNSNNSAVETHFKLVSGGIDAILTSNLAYEADYDGVFDHGLCISVPDRKTLPISSCQSLYALQSETLKASNIIIRGYLLNFFSENLK